MKSAGFQILLFWSYTSIYFTMSKWSALAPGHGEQIRATGRYVTEKVAALKDALGVASLTELSHCVGINTAVWGQPFLLPEEAPFYT